MTPARVDRGCPIWLCPRPWATVALGSIKQKTDGEPYVTVKKLKSSGTLNISTKMKQALKKGTIAAGYGMLVIKTKEKTLQGAEVIAFLPLNNGKATIRTKSTSSSIMSTSSQNEQFEKSVRAGWRAVGKVNRSGEQ